jgi:hypothetical protein
LLLAAAPGVYAQGPANDLCANDDRACHKGRADAMWLDLWGEVPDLESGLVLEPVQSALGLEGAPQWRVSARRGTAEVGSGTFVEAAGGRHSLSQEHRVQPDGTPVDVTVDWVVGTLSGPTGSSRGVLGLVVTTVVPAFTSTVLQPVAVDPDLGSAVGRSRPLLRAEVGRKRTADFLEGDQPMPPSYDYFNCLIEPSAVDPTCGEPFCDCREDVILDWEIAACSASVLGAVLGCLPTAEGGPAYGLCLLGVLGASTCPYFLTTIVDRLDQCRLDANRCYCNENAQYPYLCGNETLSVEVSGLRTGESVRVNGSCREYGAPNGVSSSAVATPENTFFDLLECGTDQRFTIETELVNTPGVPTGQGRRCFPIGPPYIDVDVAVGGEVVSFDCSCQTLDECRQGRVNLEMTVAGLAELPPTGNTHVEIHGNVEYTDETGALASIPVSGVGNGNGQFSLSPSVYAGTRITWASSQVLPPGCQVTYPIPSGSTLPSLPPDQSTSIPSTPTRSVSRR